MDREATPFLYSKALNNYETGYIQDERSFIPLPVLKIFF